MSLFRSELLPGVTGVTARRNGIVFQIGLPSSTSQTVPSGGGWARTAAHEFAPIGVANVSRRLDLWVGEDAPAQVWAARPRVD
jgi:hypothetical protein